MTQKLGKAIQSGKKVRHIQKESNVTDSNTRIYIKGGTQTKGI